MKHVALVFCEEGLFGKFMPVSRLTNANFQEAVDLLDNGHCDFLYVAMNHLDEKRKEPARKYLTARLSEVEAKIRSKIFMSTSADPYIVEFSKYLGQFSGEICVNIFSTKDERSYIESAINAQITSAPVLVFTKGVRAH